MGTSVSVDTSEVRHLFDRLMRRTADFTPVFEEARVYLAEANAENFTTGGLPVGGWAPLAPQTVTWKAARGEPPTPLVGNGHLFRSLSTLTGPPNEVHPTSATFGTNVEYAKFHQHGAPRAHLPKRQVVFVPQGFADIIARVGAHHIESESPLSMLRGLFR